MNIRVVKKCNRCKQKTYAATLECGNPCCIDTVDLACAEPMHNRLKRFLQSSSLASFRQEPETEKPQVVPVTPEAKKRGVGLVDGVQELMAGYDRPTQELAIEWLEENDAQSVAFVQEADMTGSFSSHLKFVPGLVNDKVLRKRMLETTRATEQAELVPMKRLHHGQ